jgi:hypothetical protein
MEGAKTTKADQSNQQEKMLKLYELIHYHLEVIHCMTSVKTQTIIERKPQNRTTIN